MSGLSGLLAAELRLEDAELEPTVGGNGGSSLLSLDFEKERCSGEGDWMAWPTVKPAAQQMQCDVQHHDLLQDMLCAWTHSA